MSAADFVELAGGLTVPVDAYNLILELERREFVLKQDGDRLRIAGPWGTKPDLSEEDAARIRKWKAHLLALLNYQAPERTW